MTLNRIKDEIDNRIDELTLKISELDWKIHQAHYEGNIKQEDKLIEKRRFLSSERSALHDMLRASR